MELGEGVTGRFCRLIRSFQCDRVPSDLFIRACEPKLTWSSSGEVVERLPLEAGVPKWLVDFYNTRKSFFHDPESTRNIPYVELTCKNGITYFEAIDAGQSGHQLDHEPSTIDEYSMARDGIAVFLHAFPSINIEIIGEEIVDRLMDTAESSVLPLLSCVTKADIEDWLLPKNPQHEGPFLFSLFQFLYQVVIVLGIDHPLLPLSLPERVLSIVPHITLRNCIAPLRGIAMIFNGLPSIGETSLQFRLLYSESKTDNRCNTILGYTSSMLLSRAATLGEAEGPDDYLNEALSAWQPLSPSSTSTMEYLAAISFCSHSQLASIGKPHLLTLNERAMEGLLLSRRKQHDKAAKVLNKTVVDITSHYGLRSMQLGIVSAELANCYNVLRRESLAEATLTKPLEARLDSTLWRRCDGIYLRLAMADSFIGRARYQEAVPILQSVTDDPEISATFRMMSALRLTRSRRRMHNDAQKAFEQNSPLWTGLALLGNVPEVLVMEYVEELGCSISELPKRQLEDSKNTQELIEAVNSVLCRSRSPTDNPSWEWYSKLEKEYLGHITKDPKTNKGKEKSNRLQNEDENEMKTPILSQPFPPLRSRADNGMRDDDEGPWSEKLVLSFDAGGVHSISSLLILKQIMRRIRELELYHPHGPAYSSGSSYSWIRPENGIPKVLEDSERVDEFLPCHYFDYMIGSSTGCLNSIMLGRLRISVDQAIDNFIDFGNSTFGDPRVLHSGSALFLPRAKYSIVNAQMALEKIDDSILDFMDSEISCGSHGHGHRTRTMALSLCVKGDTTSDYIWRSYRGPSIATQGEYAMHASFLFSPISVLQVALATIATPPYFGLREINGHRFLDGGLVARDPSFIAVREIQHLHKKLPAILVSLGTGLVPVASDNDYKRPAILQTAGTWLLRYRSKTSTRTSPWESADTEEQTTRWLMHAKSLGLVQARRLNAVGDMYKLPFDDWRPAGTGQTTIQEITDITNRYLTNDTVRDTIDSIAKDAVRIRRARANTEHWELFAGLYYTCPLCHFPKEHHLSREGLRNHLQNHRDIRFSELEVERTLDKGRRDKDKVGGAASV